LGDLYWALWAVVFLSFTNPGKILFAKLEFASQSHKNHLVSEKNRWGEGVCQKDLAKNEKVNLGLLHAW
jgi:hypothetical protein